jgi:uncharacterized protein (TIGR00295 family)
LTGAWPTPQDCIDLLRGAGAAEPVIAHTSAVARVAVPVAQQLVACRHAVDVELVQAGALLHDIGRAKSHGLDHASLGARMLREMGLPEPLCLIVERHTGGGIDAEDARRLGLPPKDYTPRTVEEKVVCQADNLVDGSRRQKVHEELAHLRARGLDHVAAKIEALHRELSALAGRDLDDIP